MGIRKNGFVDYSHDPDCHVCSAHSYTTLT
jgi:hypothetical protein